MATLYELTDQMQQLLEMGADPDIDEQTFLDTFEGLEGEIEEKADGYAKVIAELEGDAEALYKEITRLTLKRKTIQNNIERMKRNLASSMVITGKKKFKTDLFSFAIQKNPPSLVIDDPKKVPQMFLIPQDPKIDTASIKEKLKAGEDLDFAHLTQTESLRIR